MKKKNKRHGRIAVAFSAVLVGIALAAALIAPAGVSDPVEAAPAFNAGWKKGRETGFPVPRYVSLKFGNSRMRVGPSTDNGSRWVYKVQGLPMEITEEFGNWRQVRDYDGITGWMYAPLLSGRRTAVIGPWVDTSVPLYRSASTRASVIADLEARVLMRLDDCDGHFCRVSLIGHNLSGYVEQASLWGVYPGETIK
ncbi:SH3-like domain-containing protein [Neorhizobium huautlense]|uniref:SH3-like domain-containing protein n=1 Tax=Neorhizobium huautlense TaxID=67774 RepID=A0ABT9PZI8_9HYPH|nr:SH3 domain-containing protein [Neorhizobium huautlense]MDP9839526.1 SH3-like domain-containing protein [Neorhizobium huautlense]